MTILLFFQHKRGNKYQQKHIKQQQKHVYWLSVKIHTAVC